MTFIDCYLAYCYFLQNTANFRTIFQSLWLLLWLLPFLSFISAAVQRGFVTKGSIYFDIVEIEKMVIVVLFHDIISKKKQ